MKLLLIGATCAEDVEHSDNLFKSHTDYNKPMLYIPVAEEAQEISCSASFKWFKDRFRISKWICALT